MSRVNIVAQNWMKHGFRANVIAGDRVRWTGGFNAAVRPLQRVCWQLRLHHFWDLSRSEHWPDRVDLVADVHVREVRNDPSTKR